MGLLESLKSMTPEQLDNLKRVMDARSGQGLMKPYEPVYTPTPEDREGVDYFRPEIYDIEGFRLGKPIKIEPIPVYDLDGLRYVNPFKNNEEQRKGSLGGLLEQLMRLK